jgi:hypothetical protein
MIAFNHIHLDTIVLYIGYALQWYYLVTLVKRNRQ